MMKVYKIAISINKRGQEKSVSRRDRKFYRIIPVIIALALFGAMNDAHAQQKDEIVRVHGIPISIKAPAKTEDKKDDKKKDDSPLTEREKTLLDRIEQLEKRLAEVESRVADKPSASSGENSQPAGATTTSVSRPAETPALNTAAAAPKVGVGENAQGPTEPASAISPKFGVDSPAQISERNREKKEPFAFADFTWLSGNPRTKESPISNEYFTAEFRADVAYHHDFNHPKDNTISGSSEVFRSGEVNLTQLGIGGDFHYNNIRGRVLTQVGMYSQTQPRNDPSVARGQWNLDNAYRYLAEAYGGYHFDKMNGINVDAGIFMSYIGLWSFYNFDNWTYQPSFVSSNTPWFFTGVRAQIFPSDKLKIEPWFVNGWQSYGKFNKAPGIGGQVLWRPNGNLSLVFNNYWGQDTLGNPGRKRFHTDDSIQVKYYDKPDKTLSKAAFTFTFDAGCEYGGGVSCTGGTPDKPSQYFLGFMAYNRFWFKQDKFALTLGGGAITNPGRYLVLLPPINGATAFSGTPYFTANPGDKFRGADYSATFDYMPNQFITWRMEYNNRTSNVPYYSGPGGVTPPGGNIGPPGSFVPGFVPDLRKFERRLTFAILVKL
jgi:putative OmpL-like beta-barrel porin-2